eukprot:TRINITY_DN64448_c0_g1_i1.p1 TRINITY_DN64448_c0_g1~~TRINITY_DN64448_c0_g1_i1.p1  ORF type:complete len:193 (-),score=36.42 TRINITY_DN64448_c0_g1_i1:13-591(-)
MSNTIEIIEGCTERTSRLGLKKAMQIYGEIDACHMGDRAVMGDKFTEYPLVRFKSQSAADTALAALKAGQVFLDGIPLKGEWRGGTRRPQHKEKDVAAVPMPRIEDDAGSRVLDQGKAARNRSVSRGRRKRSRTRSRSRRRRGASPAQKKEKSGHSGALTLPTLALLLGLPENKDAGNPESLISDNPLYRGK